MAILVFFGLCRFFYNLFFLPVGDGIASVQTYLDIDANGIQDGNEPSLAGVCVWYLNRPISLLQDYGSNSCKVGEYNSGLTNQQGLWSSDFLPGSPCDAIHIFASVPEGYKPTTDLATQGCTAKFGFVQNKISVSQKVLTIDEFDRREIMNRWGKDIFIGMFILFVAMINDFVLEKYVL